MRRGGVRTIGRAVVWAALLFSGACGAADEDSSARPAPRGSIGTDSAAAPGSSGGREPVGGEPAAEHAVGPVEATEPEEPPEPAWEPEADDPREAEHPVDDPSGRALDAFYASLAATDDAQEDQEGALTRVVHMGDSSIGMDQLPHYLRRQFQGRFGDGGTGFVLMQPHSPSYRNQTVILQNPVEWEFCFIIFRCLRDGYYGLGGVAAHSHGGATTFVRTQRSGEHGRTASRIELWYAGMPRGGRLELRVDRGEPIVIDTEAEEIESRWHAVDVEPGPHSVRVRAIGGGPVRAYGVVLETDGPGVVWDTLSMIGAFTPRLLEHDPEHFAEQLAHRDPALVVLGYGGNDLRRHASRGVTAEGLEEETRQLLERVRTAVPNASCLLTGVVEHEKSGQIEITSEHMEAVVQAQREAAREAGCAFYDLYEAMGGEGSFEAWRRRGLAADDGKHLSPAGRRLVAEWMYEALVAGYVAHRTAGGA